MPIGLINTLAIFQSYIYTILKDLLNLVYIIYLNNILIFFLFKEEYKKYILIILNYLIATKLYIKLTKYKFYKQEVDFLGFLISIKGVLIDP